MSDEEAARDGGYDDLLDAIEVGEAYFLECEAGHGSFPPRHACPKCGSRELTERPLPETGTVQAHTVVHVPTPRFQDDAPYVTAVVKFGPVSLTGQVKGVEPQAVENGLEVSVDVGKTQTDEDPLVVFEP